MTKSLLLSPLLTEEQCREGVTASDIAAAATFTSTNRRREYLTWRALLYNHLQRVVNIDYRNGAPIVVDEDINIGVSHTVDVVAVVVSDNPCAVDIERVDRDVSRVRGRFFTDTERTLAVDDRAEVAIWCARECYYKLRRDKSLALLQDIEVTELDLEQGKVTVKDSRGMCVTMCIKQTAEHIVVYHI